jgi:hypothetical protein
MKRISIFLVAVFVITFTAFSQKFTQEEFMQKYLEKTGMDKYNKIKTLIIEGETQIMKDYYPFRLYFKAPNRFRMKERFKNDYTYKIIDGGIRKAIGSEDRQMDMSQLEIDMMLNIINFMEGFITNYKANGFKIEYLGLDTLNKITAYNKPAPSQMPSPPFIAKQDTFDITKIKIDPLNTAVVYKIKVITPQEKDYIMKLDTASMDILWSSGNPFIFADIAPIRFNLYEKFGGVSFPVHIKVESNFIAATFRIHSIVLNEEIPDSYFKLDSPENKVKKEE